MTTATVQTTGFPAEPLAIVGMACRLPGADDLESFWELMATGRSGIQEMPADRLDRRLYFSERQGEQSKTYSSISGIIPARPDDPSSDFRQLDFKHQHWDPCHEILCGVVDQARVHAGWTTTQLSNRRTGVYVGHSSGSALGGELVLGSVIPEVADSLATIGELQSLSESDRYALLSEFVARIQHQRPIRQANHPEWEANFAAQLVSKRFQLDGPQMVIDAACASSLFALALAGAALTQGEIGQAVVSSASYSKADSLSLFSTARSCSATGSRPFDAEADGLVSAEGYIVVLIKTLAQARLDGDQVHGIIRGIGISSDGRGRSLWAPRKEGQFEAIRRAYSAEIPKESVQYVEAHATSTQVGDATELEALSCFFGESADTRRLPLGSVKSNIGHTLETAGLAGLVKSVLCMQKGFIPPTINLKTLNPALDWTKIPFTPVKNLIPWPDLDQYPRRSAVNAFGIGGLNAHVVVDGPSEESPSATTRKPISEIRAVPHSSLQRSPVPAGDAGSLAVIGRGIIVPGAFDLNSFRELLKSGASQLTRPPRERWRDTPFSGTRPTIRNAIQQALGGYIHGYQYDWRKHHIPPLQIAHANPLQFMLLDAAQQALDESGYGDRPFDRSRAAVVVGTLFGGEFSHQLQVGLRIPEILDELAAVLRQRNWNQPRIQKFCEQALVQIMNKYPAIKDQTGSFTCSTQASRIAKTLNVMGGALAIDSGDCSSLAALQSAQLLLNSGTVDFVFCAGAQRDLDAAGFEAWVHRIESSETKFEDIRQNYPAPGEGVAVLLLRRLADAQEDGNRIFGVLKGITAASYLDANTQKSVSGETSHSGVRKVSETASLSTTRLTEQFGHSLGASGLVEIVGATVRREIDESAPTETIVRSASRMCEFQATCITPAAVTGPGTRPISMTIPRSEKGESQFTAATSQNEITITTPSNPTRMPATVPARATNPVSVEIGPLAAGIFETATADQLTTYRTRSMNSENHLSARTVSGDPATQILRVWAIHEDDLRQRLALLMDSAEAFESSLRRYPQHAPFRLAIVGTHAELGRKLKLVTEAIEQGVPLRRLQDQGVYFGGPLPAEPARMAAMFPGQGSQRTGMLSDLIATSSAANQILEASDRSLARRGISRCSGWLTGDDNLPDNDLEATQIAMLTADVCAYEVAKEWGLRPDYFIGHSFGEYAAFVAAGSLELESAIAITLARSKAVDSCTNGAGAMLSIAAGAKDVRPLVRSRTDIFLSHTNAPRQTVVAGTREGIDQLALALKSSGIPAIQIPVGSPFHTPLLQSAEPALRAALDQHRWRPPSVPVLSSVTGRFVSDRFEIVENLAVQLSKPLDWIGYVERLLAEDVRVFVEVGPGRVLTKLTQQVIGDRNAFVLSMDDSTLSIEERCQRIHAALEVAGVHGSLTTDEPRRIQAAVSRLQSFVPIQPSPTGRVEPAVKFGQSSPLAVDAVSETSAETQVEERTASAPADDALLEFLIDVIVEQTGYPRDIIEMEWDLEADLGIDSIRKAQILGELREYFDMTSLGEGNRFHELRTVNDILVLLRQLSGKGDWLQASRRTGPSVSVATTTVDFAEDFEDSQTSTALAAEIAVSETSAVSVLPVGAADEFLIDFVVERTGYPRDVVDLDADLESDLGIDSIAKAQLIGEVRDHFQLTMSSDSNRTTLAELRTLRQISRLISENSPDSSTVPMESPSTESPSSEPILKTNGHAGHEPNGSQYANGHNGVGRHNPVFPLQVPPSVEAPSETSMAFDRGRDWGRHHRMAVQNQLFDFADRIGGVGTMTSELFDTVEWKAMTSTEEAEFQGLAEGARVLPESLRLFRGKIVPNDSEPISSTETAPEEKSPEASTPVSVDSENPPVTHRFRLEMAPPELRKWSGHSPDFVGGAIVVGDSPECEMFAQRLTAFGVKVSSIRQLGTRQEAVAALQTVWQSTPSPHLFVMTPRDVAAIPSLDEDAWKQRRESGILALYWFCQKWLELVEKSKMLEDACLIGVTAMGGDFGVSQGIVAPESGALTGLFKSLIIECWMNGYRTIPIKLLDLPVPASPASVADAICVELCEPSYDVEIGWNNQFRSVLRSRPEPLNGKLPKNLVPSGNWVITGGARGITAYIVRQMAASYPNVHFHLVGTAPRPALTDSQRHLALADSGALRSEVMRSARKKNEGPLQAWQAMEKAIEIDQALTDFKAAGISVTYHSCDVAQRTQLSEVLDNIRQSFGPVRGIVHGAGVGKDASFHRKEAKMVERCLGAKLDGAINLIALTKNDALQAFITFGSISGRFGANGHTDYSLANDMLAKLTRWHRQLRPSVPSALFHWHAWDDIGMATKAETRLALKMIGMQLMPAAEGAAHFLREIEAGLPLTEVLITDTRYYRMFYPADRIVAESIEPINQLDGQTASPLVLTSTADADHFVGKATLNPTADPFLIEHRLQNRPLLPAVIMTELLAEGASLAEGGLRPVGMRNFEIVTSIKFPTDANCDVEVHAVRQAGGTVATELRADFRSRSGKLVSANRLYASAQMEFDTAFQDSAKTEKLDRAALKQFTWKSAEYSPESAMFYVGGPLRCFRKYAVDSDRKCLWGKISAPSLGELAGANRDVSRWLTPSAVFDATLYASGILLWSCVKPGVSLPQGVKHASFMRLPRPAEVLWTRCQIVAVEDSKATLDITVWGSDDLPILILRQYVAAWLPA